MTYRSLRRTVQAVAVTTVVLTAGLALSGCGSEKKNAPAAPSGWKELSGPTVSLSYPAGLTEQGKAELGKLNDAAALRTEGDRPTVKVSIQSGFANASNGDDAASVGRALLMATTEVKDTKDADIKGAKGAKRIDFSYTGTGVPQSPPKGAEVNGVVITGVDSKGKIYSVRIDAQAGKLSDADRSKIVDSIEVK
ncbi:hypothetical protein P8A22_23750 [Streptomyces laculatispora]|uniref:Lipoprotein n=1 Tax=Streptomyces laculatispora TaxID=887464 RepID=A0ABY9I7N4_9ACTN|nr:hypothetical protein [Streptomyces laculatispora]WLQ42684.1 hypothetical protein P8A22_23750 [Streptomyces laculatispora]